MVGNTLTPVTGAQFRRIVVAVFLATGEASIASFISATPPNLLKTDFLDVKNNQISIVLRKLKAIKKLSVG